MDQAYAGFPAGHEAADASVGYCLATGVHIAEYRALEETATAQSARGDMCGRKSSSAG
jgi:hypothetical protein